MTIRLAGIINDSIVDGPGFRLTVFTQGCIHNCYNCHNPETHDPTKGYLFETDKIVEMCKTNPLLRGITFSGGDPLLQPKEILDIIKKVRTETFDVVCYTGYTYEEVLQLGKIKPIYLELLNNIDYLIDGKYVDALRDLTLLFRGSSNQRIIDVKKNFKRK